MDRSFQLFPDSASTVSGPVDMLTLFVLGVSTFFTLLIFIAIVCFVLRYRRRPGVAPGHVPDSTAVELTWSIVPLLIVLVIFAWGARLYVRMERPPTAAMEVYVIGKQWMWKVQHPGGQREINELHVPRGQPVKLIMTSQDVIHDFYIPAFRTKQDVLPGRYAAEWFTPTQCGEFHLFCSEYCGTNHSKMIGKIIVMEPVDYARWLAGAGAGGSPGMPEYLPNLPLAVEGQRLFTSAGCAACHGQRGPTLAGLFGRQTKLIDGSMTLADENYLRESIVNPSAKIVAGYPTAMPAYTNLNEEHINALVAYIKSLADAKAGEGSRE